MSVSINEGASYSSAEQTPFYQNEQASEKPVKVGKKQSLTNLKVVSFLEA